MHFSDYYKINTRTDFFDVNLDHDSPLFIDPFLIRKSPVLAEQKLFPRFGDYFRYAYDMSFKVDNERQKKRLKNLLTFSEPREISIGYTEASNKGSGPGQSFTDKLLNYFLNNAARHFIKESGLYPDGQFNPITVEIFTDGLGPDGVSDLTANLIMDYLITYTQRNCVKHKVPLKLLPVNADGFNFNGGEMAWKGGGHYELPENPQRPGEAVILIPKRFLRAYDDTVPGLPSKVRYILNQDPILVDRFADFIEMKVSDNTIEQVREIFQKDRSVFKRYMELSDQERSTWYDFVEDKYGLLAEKQFLHHFDAHPPRQIKSHDEVSDHLKNLILEFKKEHEIRDGWKDLWKTKDIPVKEVVLGRRFRAMGNAYFRHMRDITFAPEMGTGSGPVDFVVVYLDIKIIIELKYLCNGSPKGVPPLPSYIHGLERQLPQYVKSFGANYAVYITAQYFNNVTKPGSHDEARLNQVRKQVPIVKKRLLKEVSDFIDLSHYNIDLCPRPSASKV